MLDVRFDFEVFDDLRSVSYRRAFSDSRRDNYAIDAALFHQITEAADTPDGITTATMVANIPVVQVPYAKRGDLIDEELDDGTTRTWTVIQAEQVCFRADWRLTVRDNVVAHDLQDTIDVETPDRTQDAAGAHTPNWLPKHVGVAAKITEISADVAEERGLRGTKRAYAIQLAEPLTVEVTDRVTDQNGVVYEIRGWTSPESITDLMVLDCERVP